MKNLKFIVILFSILYANICYSQNENWNILTLQRELYSINFFTQEKAWIYAGDYSYKSNDGGLTWSNPIKTNNNIGIGYPDYIHIVDSMLGWSTQNNNILLKTTNGGNSWITINTNLLNCQFRSVHFINRQTGWVAGQLQNLGVIAKTTNSGANWAIIANGIRSTFNSFQMISDRKGFGTTSTDTIVLTNDQWLTWEYKKGGNGQSVSRIFFLDTLNGWLLGNPDYVSKTTNGGLNWIVNTSYLGNTTNLFFLNSLTGWVTSTKKRIWKSTNAGSYWFNQIFIGNNDNDLYRDIYFKNEYTGWALGSFSQLMKSTNGGANWEDVFKNPAGSIVSLDFIDENIGWCSSSNGIYKTINRGYNWAVIYSASSVSSVDFLNSQTGFACSQQNILKTTNGGSNWIINTFGSNLSKITFINNNVGFSCGSNGLILKTFNSGINWQIQLSNFNGNLNDVYFTDTSNGFIAADNGKVLLTSNGGASWNIIATSGTQDFHSVHFVNNSTGFVVGDFHYTNQYPNSNRIVLKTTNGGINWSIKINEIMVGNYYFFDVFFTNQNTGWLAVSDENLGYISKTTNGGENWFQTFGPIGYNIIYGGIRSLYSLNEYATWAGGYNGTILTTSPPVGIQTIRTEIPKSFILSQNYPNPFNPQTKIKFAVPSNVKREMSNVKLVIYDLLGREVATLVNEELKPGTYEADWDGSNYSSGVYFYKIIAEGFVETKKMILMK